MTIKMKNFIYATAVIASTCIFSACSDDDAPVVPGSTLEAKTYTTETLAFTVDGRNVSNQIVEFTPGTDGKGSISIQSAPLDLSGIMGSTMADEMPGFSIPTAGVIPGSPKVEIPVELEGDASDCTFAGSSESTYCTFSYSGKINKDNLEFAISDIKLKNTSLAGTWYVPTWEENFYDQIRLKWISEAQAQIEMFPGVAVPMPIESIVGMALAMPTLNPDEDGNPTMNIIQMYTMLLNNVTLGEDGSVTAKYADTEAETEGTWIDAPKGLAQYVVADDNTIRLFLNPQAIIEATMNSARSRSVDINTLIEGLMNNLLPMLVNGVPVNYGQATIDANDTVNESADVKAFYLETQTLLPILKTIAPLFEDEEFVNSIIDSMKDDPSMGTMAPMLGGVLKSLPDIIETTSRIEIGVNLTKTQSAA